MYKQLLSAFFLLIATITVIIFAYYTTLIIGKKTNQLLDNRYVEVLEKTNLGFNLTILILRIGEKIYIVGLQGKSMEVLDILNEEDWVYSKDSKIHLRKKREYKNKPLIVASLFDRFKGNFKKNSYSRNGSDDNE